MKWGLYPSKVHKKHAPSRSTSQRKDICCFPEEVSKELCLEAQGNMIRSSITTSTVFGHQFKVKPKTFSKHTQTHTNYQTPSPVNRLHKQKQQLQKSFETSSPCYLLDNKESINQVLAISTILKRSVSFTSPPGGKGTDRDKQSLISLSTRQPWTKGNCHFLRTKIQLRKYIC